MSNRQHDDRQDGPATSAPMIPPKNTYVVTTPGASGGDETIYAHAVETGQSGTVRFLEYIIHPVLGPTNRVVKAFAPNAWTSYEEALPVATEESPIIIDVNGNMMGSATRQ